MVPSDCRRHKHLFCNHNTVIAEKCVEQQAPCPVMSDVRGLRKMKVLPITNTILLVCIVVFLGCQALVAWMNWLTRPHADWSNGSIHVHSVSDGPFLVTHLTTFVADRRLAAQLPHPVLINDSWGYVMSKDLVDQLNWCDYLGREYERPRETDRLGVIFVSASDTLLRVP